MKKVSILVPIYGVEKYIEKCAESLMKQTYSNIEYIFVNDCTKDNSIDVLMGVLNKYPERKEQVRIINHDFNRGLAAARNTAIKALTGDYFWHIDSDDWIEPDAVEQLVDKAEKSNADVIILGFYLVQNDGLIVSRLNYHDKESYISRVLLHTISGSLCNKFVKASFYSISGISSIEGLNHGEDYLITPRLLHKANIIEVIEKPLYYYNLVNQNSYTHNVNLRSIENLYQAYRINLEYFCDVDDNYKYTKTLNILPCRTMLSLIKNAKKDYYKNIIDSFPECKNQSYNNLTLIDRIILFLLKIKLYSVLFGVISVYKYIKK